MSDLPVWDPPAPRKSQPLPERAEVVVVGGGITGAAAMHWLARERVDAVLLERDHLAAGASGRNAGFVLTGVAANYALAARTYGRDIAREVWHFTADNHALLEEILQGRAGHARRGSLTLAASREEADLLRESEAMLDEDGLPGRWVAAGDGMPFGGLVNGADGELHPSATVDAIAGTARIVEKTAVTSIEPGTTSVRVHTENAEIEAGAVILATNAYTAALAGMVPIRPVRAQMLATAPVDARVAQRPTYAHWGYRYWRQYDDGRVLVGGWRDTAVDAEVGTDAIPNPDVQAHLDAHLASLDVTAPVTHRWAGIMGFSPDELPLVGEIPGMRNVYVCGGYTGHGMGFAVNATRVLTRHMVDGEPIPAWLRANR
ncbi:MAG TPA: FAD-binding oxidoreductase [Candidatus Dormibacteraeota bacterium]|nr:FAD-binding oxidoreductase [Candidatus Dormibacteraeota bacterium]